MKPFAAQLRAELLATIRNAEQLLLILIIPVLLLVFFTAVDVLPTGPGRAVQFLLPGVLALAVMSTAMVSQGIATGFERSYQVLKRLGVTPLGRPRLILGKIVTVLIVELSQLVLLVVLALALEWDGSEANWLRALGGVALGTFAFGGIGLTLAGRLRAELNLAAQNGLYLLLLLFGGMVFDADRLPGGLQAVSRVLPSGALATVLRDALGLTAATHVGQSWFVLATWAVAAPIAAISLFRWE